MDSEVGKLMKFSKNIIEQSGVGLEFANGCPYPTSLAPFSIRDGGAAFPGVNLFMIDVEQGTLHLPDPSGLNKSGPPSFFITFLQ